MHVYMRKDENMFVYSVKTGEYSVPIFPIQCNDCVLKCCTFFKLLTEEYNLDLGIVNIMV